MVLALSRRLLARGYRVELAAHPGQPYIEPFRQAGITVHELGIGGKGDILAPCKLAGLLRSRDIDIVHSHTRPADLAAYIATKIIGKPLVITQHGNINLDRETLTRRHDVFAFGYNVVLRGATKVAAVCQATKQELLQQCRVSPRHIQVIYNGIEQSSPVNGRTRERVRADLGINQNAVVAIITGSLKWKGHETLLSALASITAQAPNLLLLVAGTGPQEPALRQQATQLGIANLVRFLGFRQDIPDLLSASDIFVLPSRSEAFPISILEAMTAGLPVVASDIGGIPEQVEDGVTGLLVTPGDVDELTHAISRLIGNQELRRQIGEKGRDKVRQFTLERMVDGYISLYNQVLDVR